MDAGVRRDDDSDLGGPTDVTSVPPPPGAKTLAMTAGGFAYAATAHPGLDATVRPPALGPRAHREAQATADAPPSIVRPDDAGWSFEQDRAPALDLSKSRTIGRFELIREIARGGMGQVFLGRDTKLGRKVAVKFMLQNDPHYVQRFLAEARATARCAHENIVSIYEVGEHEGLPYMVLELLEGKTFSDVLDSKPTLRQVIELMIPVARALERAHEHGIVHRDIKPSNIFVTTRGQVKVLDFGVARMSTRNRIDVARLTAALQASALLEPGRPTVGFTAANSLVGTVPYMSPEQWGADELDSRSDLWPIGVMFWRAIAGAHPAGAVELDALQALMCNVDQPLPSIATRDPSLPPELVAVVDRCLAKRKRDRYQTASELADDLQRILAPTAAVAAEEETPYRGLSAFAEADAKYFFGRSNEIRAAVTQLASSPVLAVIGPSGVGKSSFIHAGLIPAIRGDGSVWQMHHLRPGRAPMARLASVIEAIGPRDPALPHRLVESPGLFGVMLRHAAWSRQQRVLVVVDQLEELFTLCDDEQVRRQFLAALLSAADDPSTPVRLVLSMRADFIDRLVAYKDLSSDLSRGLFFLNAPDRENLRETLVRPAELAGYTFEDKEVVQHMMQVATSRGALPLLSFAATRLWQARDRERRVLTTAAYNDMGGVGGAFARHADQVASAIPPQHHLLLRAIMTRLVTPDGTRAVVEHRELLSLAPDWREVQQVLDHLVHARLIQLHTDSAHETTVEIVHEMLITEWPTLQRWLDESHALRGFMHELRQAARQWVARGKPRDLVWRGATAQEALGHAKRQLLDLSANEADFMAAVREEAARTRRRKLMFVASTLTALGLVFAGGSFALIKIKLAEKQAQEEKLDAVDARQQAEAERKQADVARKEAETDRATALAAKADLQKQFDIIAEKERQRQLAEQQALAANKSEEMTKEQLASTNKVLERKVIEAQKATEEARAARRELERLLAVQRAELEELKRGKKDIIDTELKRTGGKK